MVIGLLAALIAWAVTSGGGSGRETTRSPAGRTPPLHHPGPSSSGPTVGQPPGGRDESGDSGDSGGGGDSDGGNGGSADAGSDGDDGDTGTGGPASAGGGSGGGSGGGTSGSEVPAGSPLANCAAAALELSLRTENSYGPDDKPKFRLIAKNTSATDCKTDFGPKNVVFTITEAGDDDERVWSSKDCPVKAGRLFLKVPAGATVNHTVEWDRRTSSAQCATPSTEKAGPGTYLLEAKAPGESLQRASFVLAKD
ncbi:hypothetical protein NKH18_22965 [Streptomyces sp. M10(2022)]